MISSIGKFWKLQGNQKKMCYNLLFVFFQTSKFKIDIEAFRPNPGWMRQLVGSPAIGGQQSRRECRNTSQLPILENDVKINPCKKNIDIQLDFFQRNWGVKGLASTPGDCTHTELLVDLLVFPIPSDKMIDSQDICLPNIFVFTFSLSDKCYC